MNTGSILARINFGLAVSANRLPGSRPADWEGYARLASQPRAQQVDGVIAEILGGAVSPETRSILITGQNPMLQRDDRSPGDSAADVVGDDAGGGSGGGGGNAGSTFAERLGGPPQTEDTIQSRRIPYRNVADLRTALRDRANRPLPPLTGLDQIIGLALGSPEFQRR